MSSYNESGLDAHEAEMARQETEDAAIEAAVERAFSELQVSFLLALNDGDGNTKVPLPITDYALAGILSVHELPWKLAKQPIRMALWDALIERDGESPVIEPLLLRVLAESECQLVKDLKVAMSKEYAALYADGLAQIDLQAPDSI